MAQNIIATVKDLQEATQWSLANPNTRTIQEKNNEWLQWFEKRAVRLFKDITKLGRYSLTVDVPYQPNSSDAEKGLIELRKKLRPMIPGCAIHYIDEVYDGVTICTMVIGWEKGAS